MLHDVICLFSTPCLGVQSKVTGSDSSCFGQYMHGKGGTFWRPLFDSSAFPPSYLQTVLRTPVILSALASVCFFFQHYCLARSRVTFNLAAAFADGEFLKPRFAIEAAISEWHHATVRILHLPTLPVCLG
jgi:hypothetical protein